jgi:alkylation response protein AidB-like acyl-CoA dehydrogenase
MKDQQRFPIPDPWLSDETVMLTDSVARWAQREVVAKRSAHREDFEALHRPALRSLMEQVGVQDLFWGVDGEERLSAITLAAVLEQVGRADTGLGVILANTAVIQRCMPPRSRPNLSERGALGGLVLPGFAAGPSPEVSRGPTAATVASLHGLTPQVRAEAVDGGWKLEGRAVRPQCHGARATYFGLVAEVDNEPALFVVKAAAKGLRVGEPFLKTGLGASDNADLELRGVVVDPDSLVVRGGPGYRELLAWYYLGCAATASGALLAMHQILNDWCDSRVIKGRGQRFKDNPLVGATLGEIGGLVGTGRILVYHLARRLDTAGGADEADHATAVATTRTVVGGAMEGLDRAMELMASAGYATEWNLERYWRDIKTLSTYLMLQTVGPAVLAHHYFGCRNL